MAGVSVRLDWNRETDAFWCPVCGAPVIDCAGAQASAVCEHVLFSSVSGDFEHVAPSFETAFELLTAQAEEEFLGFGDEELVARLPDGVVVFELCRAEMACGPVFTTRRIAISIGCS